MVEFSKRVINKLYRIFCRNRFCMWYIFRKKRFRILYPEIEKYYKQQPVCTVKSAKKVICIFEGASIAGGLADRLRGIVSVYSVCKELNVDFKLFFVEPFNLENYLVPNEYDWRIDRSDINYSLESTTLLILDTTEDSKYQRKKQHDYLYKKIKQASDQIHVYSNASFSYDLNYKNLFHELFKPSTRLQTTLDSNFTNIGCEYISISARFLNLLGDFNETFKVEELSQPERNNLLEIIKRKTIELHNIYPDFKIVANSDSTTFLDFIKQLPYVYITPGSITHIDAKQDTHDYEFYEKTFVDFFTIAYAKYIFLFKSKKMHKSGYPFAASLINGNPFKIIYL